MNGKNQSPSIKERDIFDHARDLPSLQKRAAYLDRECGKNQKLRASVEALLKNHFESEKIKKSAGEMYPRDVGGDKIGDTIGLYKLMEKIGEGGCGVVYRAEQQTPLRREVALKVIKLGMDTKQVISRFEAERQTLAQLCHSNIARVYDAGVTQTGRPYFVMEFINGKKITEYADAHRLTISQRLDLFKKVCWAVDYAHLSGFIHQDIKPSNILVIEESDVAVPKVIDFGIAKAMSGTQQAKNHATNPEQFIGTPAYMSPEQAGLRGLGIDRRTDIYSLGVLLYELLVGSLPFALDGLNQNEVSRIICKKKPQMPSTRIKNMAECELLNIGRYRRIEPDGFRKLLRGDLDRMVMKCLNKKRERRYGTANSLADAIQRHLQTGNSTQREGASGSGKIPQKPSELDDMGLEELLDRYATFQHYQVLGKCLGYTPKIEACGVKMALDDWNYYKAEMDCQKALDHWTKSKQAAPAITQRLSEVATPSWNLWGGSRTHLETLKEIAEHLGIDILTGKTLGDFEQLILHKILEDAIKQIDKLPESKKTQVDQEFKDFLAERGADLGSLSATDYLKNIGIAGAGTLIGTEFATVIILSNLGLWHGLLFAFGLWSAPVFPIASVVLAPIVAGLFAYHYGRHNFKKTIPCVAVIASLRQDQIDKLKKGRSPKE